MECIVVYFLSVDFNSLVRKGQAGYQVQGRQGTCQSQRRSYRDYEDALTTMTWMDRRVDSNLNILL